MSKRGGRAGTLKHTLGRPHAISGRRGECGRGGARGSRLPACLPACCAQTPSSAGIRAPCVWRSRVGAREVGARRAGLFLRPPPHPSQPFSCYLCTGRRCRPPRLRGKAAAGTWPAPVPARPQGSVSGPRCLGTGRWQGLPRSPRCGHLGPQHRPESEEGEGGTFEEGQLWPVVPEDRALWPGLRRAGFDLI